MKLLWSEAIVPTVPCSVITLTGWSVNWIVWRHLQVTRHIQTYWSKMCILLFVLDWPHNCDHWNSHCLIFWKESWYIGPTKGALYCRVHRNMCSSCIFMTGILEVLYCVLIESPEVLNIIQENHIKSIISLLDKHGRNHKVRNFKHHLDGCYRNLTILGSMPSS